MTSQKEKELKESFLQRNQIAETGIPAAIRRNKLYADNIGHEKKQEIIDYWRKQLDILAKKYKEEQSRETFLKDVKHLVENMNKKFGDSFSSTKFRFSHAQKSLSVLLKYRWCKGVISRPPVCPIDRNVLHEMHSPYKYWSWTKLSEDKYYKENHYYSVAQMELEWFENINK